MSQLVTDPTNSIIRQSYHCEERLEPLNGDGFGVAWYARVEPEPALFKDITPAWNNANLRELARVTESHCILAHVRAASPGSDVQRLNCHPFVRGTLSFMHNGFLAGFPRWRRQLAATLSDEAYLGIEGSTDSEHALAIMWDHYRAQPLDLQPLERIAQALLYTVRDLEKLKHEAGEQGTSYLNLAVADGERVVACRYASQADDTAASLYYTTGQRLRCENGRYRMEHHSPDHDVVIISSEKLSPDFSWHRVPANHLVLASHPGQVSVRPMLGPGLPAFPAAPATMRFDRGS